MDGTMQQQQSQRCEQRLTPWQLLQLCPDVRMSEVIKMVQRAASAADSSVVINGETGTGKQVLTEAIHQLSRRHAGPLEIVDCTNLDQSLIKSDLFGHERGTFTGAERQRLGAFERAKGGTVMLDEMGELPLPLQASLLQVLDRRCFTRVGGSQTIQADFRLVAATHRDLGQMVKDRAFREDLFYRLNVLKIYVPPLRERPADILPLAQRFAEQSLPEGKTKIGFAPDSERWLRNQPWPGNIRQLRNTLERAMTLVDSDESVILPCHLETEENPRVGTEHLTAEQLVAKVAELTDSVPWSELSEQIEKAVIQRALSKYSTLKAAMNLGFSRETLMRKRKAYGFPIGTRPH